MTIFQILTSTWHFETWVLATSILLIIGYVYATRGYLNKYTILFLTGVVVFFLTLSSPLSMLGKTYLFSANMIQHITLLLIVPLLLLLGLPPSLIERVPARSLPATIMRTLGHPIIAWFFGVGAMWIWHLPSLHEAVLRNESLYIVQQISFIVFGIIFWWPVFAPINRMRLSPLPSTLYLASACLGCSILGILITFASVGLYPAYLNPVDTYGILSVIRNDLCITPGVDQQIGGLTMWVPGCLIYLFASMLTLARWYRSPEDEGLIEQTLEIDTLIHSTYKREDY
jgi:cytochrome c oxidase assembly factor CtaG